MTSTTSESAPESGLLIEHRKILARLAPVLVLAGISAVSSGVFAVALPLYVLSLNGSPADWGFITAVGYFSMLIFEPLWGILSDRIGSRFLLISTRCSLVVASIVFLAQPGLVAVYLLQFARFALEAPIYPLPRAYIGAVVHPAAKGTYIGVLSGIMGIGSAFGSALAGYAIAGSGFQLAFFVCVVSAVIASFSSLLIRSQSKAAGDVTRGLQAQVQLPGAASEPVEPGFSYVWPFISVSLAAIFVLAAWSGANTFLPIVANNSLGLSADRVGIVLMVANLGNAFLMFPAGYIADRKGRNPTIAAGVIIGAVAMVGFALVTSFWALILTVLVFSVMRTLTQTARVALMSDLMPKGRQGTVMGLMGAVDDVGVMMGTAGGGLLWGWFGREITFMAFMAYEIAALLVCAFLIREREWVSRLSRAKA